MSHKKYGNMTQKKSVVHFEPAVNKEITDKVAYFTDRNIWFMSD